MDGESVEPFEDVSLFTFKLLRWCDSVCRPEGGAQGPERECRVAGRTRGSLPLAGGPQGNCFSIVPGRCGEEKEGVPLSLLPLHPLSAITAQLSTES